LEQVVEKIIKIIDQNWLAGMNFYQSIKKGSSDWSSKEPGYEKTL